MDMDKGILNDDPSVTLTIRLIMQGKVKSVVVFYYNITLQRNIRGLKVIETLQELCN